MKDLTNTQKQFLRRSAHDLKPVVQVGKNGLAEQLYIAGARACRP
jgi:RNA-binding protein YhbY